MVFDATVSGINNSRWDPIFMFSSMGSLLVMVVPMTDVVDIVVGRCFTTFNFPWY